MPLTGPLETGARHGNVADVGPSDLAGVRAQAVDGRDFQALEGSIVHRQGPRYRGPVPLPADKAVVLCVDEKTAMQALERTQPILPLSPGKLERRTHDYERNGVTDLFAALEGGNWQSHRSPASPAPRRRVPRVPRHHRRQRARRTRGSRDVGQLLDPQDAKAISAWLVRHPRFKLHFTPTSARG